MRDWVPWLGVVAVVASLLSGCSEKPRAQRSLSEIERSGELIILTLNAPTSYYEGREGFEGIEYDMATAFAGHMGVEPRFVVTSSVSELLEALRLGKGDLAAAGLTRTSLRADSFRFGPTYQEVTQRVVCRPGNARPQSLDDLEGLELRVVADSSYAERLRELAPEYPKLSWTEESEGGTEELIKAVWEGKIDCTVADSNILAINHRYFPELVEAFDLSEPQPLAWAMPKDSESLQLAVNEWFDGYAQEELRSILDKYYGFVEIFDWVNTREFGKRVDSHLPAYRKLFQRYSKRIGVDWTLLAALAYQESRWEPKAESPTGVRGIMMLTLAAASEVGVEDRLDPSESIRGGAQYFRMTRDRLSESIPEPDRTWIALAAYNVGMGHLRDAQQLAKKQGLNPERWVDLAEVLPLLAKRKFYATVPHGYARGWEPVFYVNRIRHYQDLLDRKFASR